jgi:hypothetical protein
MSHTPDFLAAHEPVKARRPRRLHRSAFVAIALVFVLLLAWAGTLVVAAGAVVNAMREGKTSLDAARAATLALDFPTAESSLETADAAFARAQTGLLALDTVRWLPFVRPYADAAEAGALAGKELSDGLLTLVNLGGELMRLSGLSAQDIQAIAAGSGPHVTFNDLSTATKRTMLVRLASSADQLDDTVAELDIARSELAGIDRSQVPYAAPFLSALDPTLSKLADMEDGLRLLARGARLLPAFAGLDRPQTSLLLFLNNAELRPGGGFIGTYGVLTMKDGDVASLETKDVYAVDGPAANVVKAVPPAPLQRWLGVSQWFFRDANWSPDFGASASQSLSLFDAERHAVGVAGPDPTQVIGFTPTFAAELLRLTGDIEVGGQTFTPQNVADRLEYQVEYGYVGQGIPLAQRKEILADLVDEMKARLEALPASKWGDVASAFERAVTDKQLLVWSADADTQKVAQAVGWSGTVTPPAWGDAQMVVDANLAALKSDPAVHRAITYEISTDASGQFVGKTTIRYQHTGSFDWKTTRYRTYVRLYVPQGSTLISATGTLADDKTKNPSLAPGTVDVGADLGFTTFGAFTAVEPGATQAVTFTYKLAPSVVDAIRSGSYKLAEFKQAGAAAYGLTLSLNLGKKLTNATPPEDPSHWGDTTYTLSTSLDQDRTFQVSL